MTLKLTRSKSLPPTCPRPMVIRKHPNLYKLFKSGKWKIKTSTSPKSYQKSMSWSSKRSKIRRSASRISSRSSKPSLVKASMLISCSIKKSKWKTVPAILRPKWLKTHKTATALTSMYHKILESVAKANSNQCSALHSKWHLLQIQNSKDSRNLFKWFEILTTLLPNKIKKSKHSNFIKRKLSSQKIKCCTKVQKPSIRLKNKSSKSRTKSNKKKFKTSSKPKSCNFKKMGKKETSFRLLKLDICFIQTFKSSNKLFKTKLPLKAKKDTVSKINQQSSETAN